MNDIEDKLEKTNLRISRNTIDIEILGQQVKFLKWCISVIVTSVFMQTIWIIFAN